MVLWQDLRVVDEIPRFKIIRWYSGIAIVLDLPLQYLLTPFAFLSLCRSCAQVVRSGSAQKLTQEFQWIGVRIESRTRLLIDLGILLLPFC